MDGEGEGSLERIVLADQASGKQETAKLDALFVLIGAVPRTGWLAGVLERDSKGFILTGADVRPPNRGASPGPPIERLETSLPGVFAVGDVRAGSVKRVASAVGESATAVQHVHAYLAAAAAQPGEAPRSGSARKKLAKGVTGALPCSGSRCAVLGAQTIPRLTAAPSCCTTIRQGRTASQNAKIGHGPVGTSSLLLSMI